MKKIFTAGVLALLILACSFARADEKIVEPKLDPNSPTVIKAKMIENYLGLREAIKNRDADFIIASEAPEYTNRLYDGEVRDKAESDKVMRFLFIQLQTIHSAEVIIKSIIIEPQRTVVLSETRIEADILGPDNKTHRVKNGMFSRDIWVRYQSEWFLKRSEDMR